MCTRTVSTWCRCCGSTIATTRVPSLTALQHVGLERMAARRSRRRSCGRTRPAPRVSACERSRRASPRMFCTMPFMRWHCDVDDLQQPAVGLRQVVGLLQQLRRIADRRQRIADLVRDAGRQPAQRGQRQLLGAAGIDAAVVEEDQEQLVGQTQRHEARQHLRRAFGEGHGLGDFAAAADATASRLACRASEPRAAGRGRGAKALPSSPQAASLTGGSGATPSTTSTPVRMRRITSSFSSDRLASSSPRRLGERLAVADLPAQLLAQQRRAEVGNREHRRLGRGCAPSRRRACG